MQTIQHNAIKFQILIQNLISKFNFQIVIQNSNTNNKKK